MIKDFKLCIGSLGFLIQELTKAITSSPNKSFRVTIVAWRESRSKSQNSLYWKWLGEIAKQQNVSDDPEIWHEIFKKYYCPEKPVNEHVSIKSTKKLDKGEMCFYLNRIEQYCMDRGYMITIPADCDYIKNMEEQER